jgi:hypothetical protein
MSIRVNGSALRLKWGDDFIMSGNPLKPDASVEAPVVFAGYGVKTPDGRYDDYSGVDVKERSWPSLAARRLRFPRSCRRT